MCSARSGLPVQVFEIAPGNFVSNPRLSGLQIAISAHCRVQRRSPTFARCLTHDQYVAQQLCGLDEVSLSASPEPNTNVSTNTIV
jgi:hypothetical protein